MWAGILTGALLASSATALRFKERPSSEQSLGLGLNAFSALSADNESYREVFLPGGGAEIPANETWNHTGPSNSSWKLWLKYTEPPSVKMPMWMRGEEVVPAGVPSLNLSDEYYGRRRAELRFASNCGLNTTKEPLPREGWVVTGVRKPALMPFIVPEGTPGRRDIIVVVVPGGGGEELAWDAEGVEMAVWLNTLGISAVILKYRLPWQAYGHLSLAMDVQRAVTLTKYTAPSLGLKPSRVGVLGSSYGAAVALRATASNDLLYNATDAADGYADWRPAFLLLLYPGPPMEFIRPDKTLDYSFTKDNLPPMFVAFAEDDPCIASRFQWIASGVLMPARKVELHMYHGGSHGFGICLHRQLNFTQAFQACTWVDRAREFMERTFDQRKEVASKAYEERKALLFKRRQ